MVSMRPAAVARRRAKEREKKERYRARQRAKVQKKRTPDFAKKKRWTRRKTKAEATMEDRQRAERSVEATRRTRQRNATPAGELPPEESMLRRKPAGAVAEAIIQRRQTDEAGVEYLVKWVGHDLRACCWVRGARELQRIEEQIKQREEQLVRDKLMAQMLQRAEEEELESELRGARAERRGSLRKRRREEPASTEGCDTAASCAICLAPLEGQATCTTECGHCFHTDCVMAWLSKARSTCPLCQSHVSARRLTADV